MPMEVGDMPHHDGKPKPLPLPFSQHELDRFEAKIDRTPGWGPRGDCWKWTGCHFTNGQCAFKTRHDGHGMMLKAQRIAFFIAHGIDPYPNVVQQTCEWKFCVRHLAALEQREYRGQKYYWLMDQLAMIDDDLTKPWTDYQCIEWPYAHGKKGHGMVAIPGSKSVARAKVSRISYEFFKGPLGNLFACHHCDNPACFRASHLFAGTNADNMRDMKEKGRGRNRSREQHNLAKLTWDIVACARQKREEGASIKEVAEAIGLSWSATRSMLIGETWAPEGQKAVRVYTGIVRGTNNPTAKLDRQKAALIRELHAAGESLSALARQFGVNSGTIHGVVNARTWREEHAPKSAQLTETQPTPQRLP